MRTLSRELAQTGRPRTKGIRLSLRSFWKTFSRCSHPFRQSLFPPDWRRPQSPRGILRKESLGLPKRNPSKTKPAPFSKLLPTNLRGVKNKLIFIESTPRKRFLQNHIRSHHVLFIRSGDTVSTSPIVSNPWPVSSAGNKVPVSIFTPKRSRMVFLYSTRFNPPQDHSPRFGLLRIVIEDDSSIQLKIRSISLPPGCSMSAGGIFRPWRFSPHLLP